MAEADDQPRDALSALVREASAAGDSYGDIAKRAIDPETGLQLTKPWIGDLANGDRKSPPSTAQLRALAVGLRRPLVVIQRAAARQYLDFDARELSGYSDDVRVVVAHLAGMTDAEVRQYRAMIEASERVKHEQ
jgi:hypothetical protein